jgi:hypothetical protein
VVLKTEEDMGWASDDLATLRKLRKDFEKKLKDLCQPFKDGIEALKAEFDIDHQPAQGRRGGDRWEDYRVQGGVESGGRQAPS